MKKVVGETENTYQEEFRSFVTSVRSIRHDFINHIQVLYGLLQLQYYPRAMEYMKSLMKEVKLVDTSRAVNN
ncbi:Spo0B domain-containing protein, partial [Salmonella enterica subsp. enterica]